MVVRFLNWAWDKRVEKVFDDYGISVESPMHLKSIEQLFDVVQQLLDSDLNIMILQTMSSCDYAIACDTKRFQQR